MHTPISLNAPAANCPMCGVYAKIDWLNAQLHLPNGYPFRQLDGHKFGLCNHCNKCTIWKGGKLIYPYSGSAPIPNPDLPNEIKCDYEEARSIVELSPRGAVALLRLCVEKLCKELGEEGKNINTDIKNLVAGGLPLKMQQALDSVRVIGNNAVHPGQLDITDDTETAYKLFGFVNIIADILITQPKQIDEFYNIKLPTDAKVAIEKRDKKPI